MYILKPTFLKSIFILFVSSNYLNFNIKFSERGEFRVDSEGTPTLLNCLMYKLSYYRFGDLKLDYQTPAGFDRTRNAVIGHKDFDLTYLEEAYTTEHWLVRIYRYFFLTFNFKVLLYVLKICPNF